MEHFPTREEDEAIGLRRNPNARMWEGLEDQGTYPRSIPATTDGVAANITAFNNSSCVVAFFATFALRYALSFHTEQL